MPEQRDVAPRSTCGGNQPSLAALDPESMPVGKEKPMPFPLDDTGIGDGVREGRPIAVPADCIYGNTEGFLINVKVGKPVAEKADEIGVPMHLHCIPKTPRSAVRIGENQNLQNITSHEYVRRLIYWNTRKLRRYPDETG